MLPTAPRRLSYQHGLLVLFVLTSPVAAQTVLTVDTTADDPALTSCLPEVPLDCSLRGAISTANLVPQAQTVAIHMVGGIHELSVAGAGEDGNQTGDLDVLRSMTIDIPDGEVRFISAGVAFDDRALEVHGSETLLILRRTVWNGFDPGSDAHALRVRSDAGLRMEGGSLLANGSTDDGGGGLRLEQNSTAVLSAVELRGNQGFDGGAVHVDGALLTMEGCSVVDNFSSATGGGGLYVVGSTAEVTIQRSLFDGNRALIFGNGGAIWSAGRTEVTIFESELRGNRAQTGAAIFTEGTVAIARSALHGNLALVAAGAIRVDSGLVRGGNFGNLTAVNVTVSGNETPADTAAIEFVSAAGELRHVTSVGHMIDLRVTDSAVDLGESLLEGGCDLLGKSSINTLGANLTTGTNCWPAGAAAGDEEVVSLDLLPLGSYGGPTPSHMPEVGSPALARQVACGPDSDQRLVPRDLLCDSGSVERLDGSAEPWLFSDGFESGTTTWSVVSP